MPPLFTKRLLDALDDKDAGALEVSRRPVSSQATCPRSPLGLLGHLLNWRLL